MRRILLATLTLAAVASPMLAAGTTKRSAGTVEACSRFGKGCTSAPVRQTTRGPEIRLPGGTWISCAGNCKDTLRDETVDFWAKREFERAGEPIRRD